MHKFIVYPPMEIESPSKEKTWCCVLSSLEDPSMVLMFPVGQKDAQLIDAALGFDSEWEDLDDSGALALYETMISSWKSSNVSMGGILIDCYYNTEDKENFIKTQLMMLTNLGDSSRVDGLVSVNFSHAIILAAMQRNSTKIFISDELLDMLLPEEAREGYGFEDEPSSSDVISNSDIEKLQLKEDKNLLKIVKQIMSGKIK